jgi:hypothetical protein
LDTILGYTDNETIDIWVDPTNGPVCEQISDTIATYYDFSGQSQGSFVVATSPAAPIETQAFSETLGLQSITLDKARHALTARAAGRSLAPQVELATARLERFRQAYRTGQLRRMHDLFMHGHITVKRGQIK